MENTRPTLSALWIALMLTYLLGDVLRIFSGDFESGAVGTIQVSQGMFLGMAVLFTLPILMVFLTLTLPQDINRWANIGLSALFFFINAIGLPTYPSLYDQFLIVVGLILNVMTIWYAWRWRT
jgi:hypothetical protein